MSEEIAIIYIPCGSEDSAAALAGALLDEGLIACANIYPSRSLYRWQGTLVDETEFVVFAKTTAQASRAVERRITELHTYELPCIITINPAAVNAAYAEWVTDQVKGFAKSQGSQLVGGT